MFTYIHVNTFMNIHICTYIYICIYIYIYILVYILYPTTSSTRSRLILQITPFVRNKLRIEACLESVYCP